jgi:hypothetical protein
VRLVPPSVFREREKPLTFRLTEVYLLLSPASEIVRQTALLEAGRVVIQETRGWDDTTNSTVSLRSKEGEKDYRYMPDGNLPVVAIDPVKALLLL